MAPPRHCPSIQTRAAGSQRPRTPPSPLVWDRPAAGLPSMPRTRRCRQARPRKHAEYALALHSRSALIGSRRPRSRDRRRADQETAPGLSAG